MTKEEAISVLEQAELKVGIKWRNGRPEVYISPYLQEAIDFALTKLHPISRERVEKTSRGEWLFEQADWTTVKYGTIRCSKCGNAVSVGGENVYLRAQRSTNFCPNCGAPMTDEAVDMVMKRMEELKDETIHNN